MRTPVDQAELFLNRALQLEKRAAGKHEGKLKETLLALATHYHKLAKEACEQAKRRHHTVQMKSEGALLRQFVA